MPRSDQAVPNKPLVANELAVVICDNLRELLKSRVVDEYVDAIVALAKEQLAADCMFNVNNLAYRKAAFTLTAVVHSEPDNHRCAATVYVTVAPEYVGPPKPRATFRTYVRHRTEPLESDAPLSESGPDAVFVALERRVEVDNPNLTRIHHALPIKVVAREMPDAGNPFPRINTREIRYEPGDYPPLAEPQDTDVSEEWARKFGVQIVSPVDDRAIDLSPAQLDKLADIFDASLEQEVLVLVPPDPGPAFQQRRRPPKHREVEA